MVAHYKANLALAESLYTSLSVFEVTLRNALSKELERMMGRKDWYAVFPSNPALKSLTSEVTVAIRHISQRGEMVTPDKIVAELTFGFWVTLLNSEYELTLWKGLRLAFPYMPKKDRKRKNVSSPCNALRKLRNRVFHHESICWDLDYISGIHSRLVQVLGWMNQDMPGWLVCSVRVVVHIAGTVVAVVDALLRLGVVEDNIVTVQLLSYVKIRIVALKCSERCIVGVLLHRPLSAQTVTHVLAV